MHFKQLLYTQFRKYLQVHKKTLNNKKNVCTFFNQTPSYEIDQVQKQQNFQQLPSNLLERTPFAGQKMRHFFPQSKGT